MVLGVLQAFVSACVLGVVGGAVVYAPLARAPTSPSHTPAATFTVATSVPSPTAPLNASLPPQAPLSPLQARCASKIFCNGWLLQTINIAQLYGDSKTFVDKPTVGTANKTLSDFYSLYNASSPDAITNYSDVTYGAIEMYVENDYKGEGLELELAELPSNTTPPFLQPNSTSITSPIVHAWATIVHTYWANLARNTNSSALCDGAACESTLIPLNHTFVVPGGRFREQYYWDSYWIIEGLIQSELFDLARSTLQNFMDELERFGFIPNGGRIYYLNRSQPPLFMKMLYAYVNATGDLAILDRAFPLAEVELNWWYNNRTINITSPYSGKTRQLARYAVINSAPRPEGFMDDYVTANGDASFTEEQKEALYAELASGAESGHDYTARWVSNPHLGNSTDQTPLLRTLNVRGTIPVDLNSILYKYRCLLAELYELAAKQNIPEARRSYFLLRASFHKSAASNLKTAILDVFWESSTLAFYDFNLTSNKRNTWFSPAAFYPFWNGIVPNELLEEEKAKAAFSAVRMVLARYNGTFPASFVETGLQWDAPNAWPPHQFIIIEALRNLPANISSTPLAPLDSHISSFSLVPPGQLGLEESDLPVQPISSTVNASSTGPLADINEIDTTSLNGSTTITVTNGGPAVPGEGWATTLAREMANRYVSSVFCSWYATGGSIPGLLPRLPDSVLNLTYSVNNTGRMFEKVSMLDINVAGSGGEYVVQAGFGWTNGVALWIAANFGPVLSTPTCPNITDSSPAAAVHKRAFPPNRAY